VRAGAVEDRPAGRQAVVGAHTERATLQRLPPKRPTMPREVSASVDEQQSMIVPICLYVTEEGESVVFADSGVT
jgi:hypothetical protein